MTASNANNVILSQTSIGGSGSDLGFTTPLTVTIATEFDEEVITKAMTIITPPKSTPDQEKDTDDPDYGSRISWLIDMLNKVEKRITIDGYLANGLGTNDSSSTAEGKKVDLKKIFEGGGVFNMKYEGEVFTVNADQLSIKRARFDGLTGDDGVYEFSVKITMIRGDNFNAS